MTPLERVQGFSEAALRDFVKRCIGEPPRLCSVSYIEVFPNWVFTARFGDYQTWSWEIPGCEIPEARYVLPYTNLVSLLHEGYGEIVRMNCERVHASARPAQMTYFPPHWSEVPVPDRYVIEPLTAFDPAVPGSELTTTTMLFGHSYALSDPIEPVSFPDLVASMQRAMERSLADMMAFGVGVVRYPIPSSADGFDPGEAEERGLKLLREWLSPVQLKQFEMQGSFDVTGCHSGTRYRIRRGRQQNVFQLDRKGREICGWCFAPDGYLVEGDVMLAQKVALETDERGALSVANRFGGLPSFGSSLFGLLDPRW